jgi:hypothetical protein
MNKGEFRIEARRKVCLRTRIWGRKGDIFINLSCYLGEKKTKFACRLSMSVFHVITPYS